MTRSLVAAALALSWTLPAAGQAPPAPTAARPAGSSDTDPVRSVLEYLDKTLGLAPKQKAEVQKILQSSSAQRKALEDQKKALDEKIQAVAVETRKKLDAVLTDEQRAKMGGPAAQGAPGPRPSARP